MVATKISPRKPMKCIDATTISNNWSSDMEGVLISESVENFSDNKSFFSEI